VSDQTAPALRAALLEREERRRPPFQPLRSVLASRSATLGWLILFGTLLAAALAPLLAPYDPNLQELERKLRPPVWQSGGSLTYLLGSDHLGRDLLSRVLFGARISLLVGWTAVLLSGSSGVLLGLLSGYFGGWVERVIMRLSDMQLAFPVVLLAIAIAAVLGPSLPNLILVLAVTGWMRFARVVRADVLALREREFVQAAQVLGASDRRIIGQHLLPNILAPVIVLATLEFARVVILEAALSFLGLGAPREVPSWGGMLADGRDYLTAAWWPATIPGLALTLTVLGANLVGDWLQDVLDPQLRRRATGPNQ
jgi:peptide/nickel transport system permease protein